MPEQIPKWLEAAREDELLHVRAIPGPQTDPRIVAMFALCGHAAIIDDETPWCAAAAGSWLVRAGQKGTGQLTADSYRSVGEPLDGPRVGAIAIVTDAEGKGTHVALVDEITPTHVHLIGGNQGRSQGVSEVNVSAYKLSPRILYRWPIEEKTAKELGDEGSRHIAKGSADTTLGWVTTATAIGGGASAITSTGEATAGLLTKLSAHPWLFGLLLVGIYLIASGHLVKMWRVADHFSGRKW